MKLEQAARQALNYLENSHARFYEEREKAITALREALDNPEERGTSRYEGWVEVAEQAEHEPVAWLYDWEHEGEIVTGWVTQDFETTKFNNGHNVRPLYAALVAAHERENRADHSGDITNLVKAAVLAEREACAKMCEQLDDESYPHTRKWPSDCAAAIRSRNNAN